MNFRKKQRARPQGLQMTALMDVIFLLLCFFVTASVYSQWESEISIRLPSAKTADDPDRLPGEIIANVAKDGTVRVNGQTLPLDELAARLERIAKFYPGQAVIVRADRETSYEALVRVIDTCRSAGVWNFSLATSNEER